MTWSARLRNTFLAADSRSNDADTSPGAATFAATRFLAFFWRTFAWIFKNRRLVRDYEQLTAVAETLITIAASATLLRRWA